MYIKMRNKLSLMYLGGTMRYKNYRLWSLTLIVGLWFSEGCLTFEPTNSEKGQSLAQMTSVFDPKSYQRLNGEIDFEEDCLRCLKQLHTMSEQSKDARKLQDDEAFLRVRDQLANSFLKLFSYAVNLPNAHVLTITKVIHLNVLEDIITLPHMQRAINGIYSQRPILRDTGDAIFNAELSDDNFKYSVWIGRSPFFEPLCHLLDHLYNGGRFEDTQDILRRTRAALEARYIYCTYIKSLERVRDCVRKIIGKQIDDMETKQKAAQEYILKNEDAESEDDDDDDFGENTGFITQALPQDVDDYLSFNQDTAYLFKRLKDILCQDVSYRYGIDDKNPLLSFPPDLIALRKSIPWVNLSALGSAAHLAKENNQKEIQRMFINAVPDLLIDFRTLDEHLTVLEAAERAYFLGQPREPAQRKFNYPYIDCFTRWYLPFIGFGMFKTHIREVAKYGNSLDKPEVVFEDLPHHHIEWEKEKIPFLFSKSRFFALCYLFVDGELSKIFAKRLDGKVDKSWSYLFDAFKKLRDDIMHNAQLEGIEAFEKRLEQLSNDKWNILIRSYLELLDVVSALDQQFDVFDWQMIKQGNWRSILTAPTSDPERRVLSKFCDNLQHLSTFITTGSWEDLEKTAKDKYDNIADKFKKTLPASHHGQFNPDKFWSKTEEGWQGTYNGLKKVLNEAQIKLWEEVKACALAYKKIKDEKKSKASSENKLEELKSNIYNAQWILQQLQMLYNHQISRFSTVPEGRIAELYIMLLRESANNIIFGIPNFLVFNAHGQSVIQYLNACSQVSRDFRTIISYVGNHKAHLHRLVEVVSHETHFQSIGNLLRQHIDSLKRNLNIILEHLSKNDIGKETSKDTSC